MVKAAYIDKNGLKKGAWSEEEDNKLRAYILRYGHWNWRLLPKYAGLDGCGKSCRLRWLNYLKPDVKRGNYSKEEEELIAKLHDELGTNRWSAIAAKLPGRTDNDLKNYWHGHLKKRSKRTSKSWPPEEKSSEKSHCINHEKEVSCSDVTSVFPILSSPKVEKRSEVSSDIYILESSSSNSVVSGAVANRDLDSTVGQNLSEISLSGSDSVAFSWGSNIDDSVSSSDPYLSEFQGSFWTEPFMVDNYDTLDFLNFLLLDEDGLLPTFQVFNIMPSICSG